MIIDKTNLLWSINVLRQDNSLITTTKNQDWSKAFSVHSFQLFWMLQISYTTIKAYLLCSEHLSFALLFIYNNYRSYKSYLSNESLVESHRNLALNPDKPDKITSISV